LRNPTVNEFAVILEKFGLAAAVLLLCHFQILPELRAIRKELLGLAYLIAKQNGISLDEALDWLHNGHTKQNHKE
jgi:hypothetical protein